MNIYLFGNQGRFDFFQELADQQVSPFATTLALSRLGGTGVYSSSLMPLYTTLILPQEGQLPQNLGQSDQILVIDQYPFATDTVKNLVHRLKAHYPYTTITVLLDHSKEEVGEDAMQQGKRDYHILGCIPYTYQKGDSKEFLHFQKCTWGGTYVDILKEQLTSLEKQATSYVKTQCKQSYLFHLEDTLENPRFLDEFTAYHPSLTQTDVYGQYILRSFAHCFETEWKTYILPYWKIYKTFLGDVWLWEEEADFQCFLTLMKQAFLFRAKALQGCLFLGETPQEYILFLNQNQADVKFKQKLLRFFQVEVEEIVLKYVQGKLEGLKNEVA